MSSRLSRTFSTRSPKKTCTICFENLKTGKGQAIFTAECSHSFHFNCIANNVKHGSKLCPVCRAEWNEVPFQAPSDPQRGRARVSPFLPSHEDFNGLTLPPQSPPESESQLEPLHFSDDEPLLATITADATSPTSPSCPQAVTVKAFLEFPAISASTSVPKFAVLVGVRAPPLHENVRRLERAPVDLVTLLDVSGSMHGSKLSLLKRAVCFVIQNLGPSDRLSIVTFSSVARRIFPLRRMSDGGREDAILATNSLIASGSTNIVEGLKKGVRVLEERRERNPVSSIILLSDGKDTHNAHQNRQKHIGYLNLLPSSICPINRGAGSGNEPRQQTIPVHTFGFGSDHDSTAMHDISNASGGTFSFIESVVLVQDAFARCIGGLLSVVAQELRVKLKSISEGVNIGSIASGRYFSEVSNQGKDGLIDIGDLYADEEKEFLIYLSVPVLNETTPLLDVMCSYKDVVSKAACEAEGKRIEIRRHEVLAPDDMIVSVEVDRQRNRLLVAEAISEAQVMAENGNLDGAQAVLAQRRSALLSSASAQAGDGLCNWLEAELGEIRERIASQESYEQTGRAYMLSGLSSHSFQRATTRGDSTTQTFVVNGEGENTSTSAAIGYDTPSMVSMVTKSQILNFTITPEQGQQRYNKSCSMPLRRD